MTVRDQKAPKKDKIQLVSLPIIADFLLLTIQRVRQLVVNGVIPDSTNGEYDLLVCVQSYIKYKNQLVLGQGTLSLSMQRTRLTQINADRKLLELRQLQGELIPTYEAMQKWGRVVQQSKTKIMALPTKIAPIAINCKSIAEVKQLVETHCHEILFELSNPRLDNVKKAVSEKSSKEDIENVKKVKKKKKTKRNKKRKEIKK